MHLAMQGAWAAYRESSTWSQLSGSLGYWLVTEMTPDGTQSRMVLHYNLLTGELLVNGLPLARLLSDYETHRTYCSLFGRSQLDVMPTNEPGMHFSCQAEYLGHTIHLGKETSIDYS